MLLHLAFLFLRSVASSQNSLEVVYLGDCTWPTTEVTAELFSYAGTVSCLGSPPSPVGHTVTADHALIIDRDLVISEPLTNEVLFDGKRMRSFNSGALLVKKGHFLKSGQSLNDIAQTTNKSDYAAEVEAPVHDITKGFRATVFGSYCSALNALPHGSHPWSYCNSTEAQLLQKFFEPTRQHLWSGWNANPEHLQTLLEKFGVESANTVVTVTSSDVPISLQCHGENLLVVQPGSSHTMRTPMKKCFLQTRKFPDMKCPIKTLTMATNVDLKLDGEKLHVKQWDSLSGDTVLEKTCGSFRRIKAASKSCENTNSPVVKCYYSDDRWTSYHESRTSEFFPRWSKDGYKLVEIPQKLWQELNSYWKNNRMTKNSKFSEVRGAMYWMNVEARKRWLNKILPNFKPDSYENIDDIVMSMNEEEFAIAYEESDNDNPYITKDGEEMVPCGIACRLPDHLASRLNQFMRDSIKEWVNVTVQDSMVYGVREYQPGAKLQMHTDRFKTHVLSGTIFVGGLEEDDDKWPLQVWNHDGEVRNVAMNSTHNLILYESSTVYHGRPHVFEGNAYAGVYAHYKPDYWEDDVSEAYEDYMQTWEFVDADHLQRLREIIKSPKADPAQSYLLHNSEL